MSMKMAPEENKADTWFHQRAEPFLRGIGVRECLQVADVGCHNGHFAIPVARIVGSCGTVYAIDKNEDALSKVKQRIKAESWRNIKVIQTDLAGDDPTPIASESIDFVLLYDVLHRGYMPEKAERLNMLKHVHHMIKPGGVLSCFPTHLKKFGFTFEALLGEIADSGFSLVDESRPRLVHDGKLVRGRVFHFRRHEM